MYKVSIAIVRASDIGCHVLCAVQNRKYTSTIIDQAINAGDFSYSLLYSNGYLCCRPIRVKFLVCVSVFVFDIACVQKFLSCLIMHKLNISRIEILITILKR